MSNQQALIEVIKAMSGQANILTIPRPYVDYMGSLDGGLFLSQLIYWSDRSANDDGWFYKTYSEWEEETTLSKYEAGKQAKILKEKGVLETKLKKANGAPTVHYHFLFDEFQKSFVEFLYNRKSRNSTIESQETQQSLTETTTETTTNKDSVADATGPNFDFLNLTIDQVKTHLESFSEEELKTVLEIEKEGKNRVGITRFIEHKLNGDESNGQPWGDMFKTLADLCQYDTAILSGRDRGELAHAAKTMLTNGYTKDDIEAFGKWWYTDEWRKSIGPPKLYQVREYWGRYKNSLKSNSNGHHNGDGPQLTDEELAAYHAKVNGRV